MSTRYRINDKIIFREEGEGAFLFDSVNGNLKYLNRSAKEIYLMIDGSRGFDHLLDDVVEIYPDSDREKVEKDLDAFLNDLAENRFISVVDRETE